MRFPSLHKLHAQKYKTSLSHRFMQCSGKPGRWVIFHIPFCAVSARGATSQVPIYEQQLVISIHAPARGATWPLPLCCSVTPYFNSRPCERGDFHPPSDNPKIVKFQFTPLREGRRKVAGTTTLTWEISIHAPARGATVDVVVLGLRVEISIHAPARGATMLPGVISIAVAISIHAPARGATPRRLRRLPRPYFNSRPCERGDRNIPSSELGITVISIHAPARGATDFIANFRFTCKFQFTPLREGRRSRRLPRTDKKSISIHAPARGATVLDYYNGHRDVFQFTPLREGRLGCVFIQTSLINFNSRPCERGDAAARQRATHCFLISIHAPARGATQQLRLAAVAPLFQFTPLREGRPDFIANFRFNCKFQFTPLREGRLQAQGNYNYKSMLFQFTPLREGRRQGGRLQDCGCGFQFTPLREGRQGGRTVKPPRYFISIHAPARGATVTVGSADHPLYPFQFTPLREGRPSRTSTWI